MMRRYVLTLLTIALLGLTGLACGSGPCDDKPEGARCSESTGGFGQQICLCETDDSGKTCTDSSECEGACVAEASDSMCEAQTQGTCSSVTPLFGCYCRVDSESVAVICVD